MKEIKQKLFGFSFLLVVALLCVFLSWVPGYFAPGEQEVRQEEKSPSSSELSKIRLRVSRGFSNELASEDVVIDKFSNGINIFPAEYYLGTSLGGAFVKRILTVPGDDELSNGSYWFYYVNGRLAGVGAKSYRPQDGDEVWWDFHRDEGCQPRLLLSFFPQKDLLLRGKKLEEVLPQAIYVPRDWKSVHIRLREWIDLIAPINEAKIELKYLEDITHRVNGERTLLIASFLNLMQIEALAPVFSSPAKWGLCMPIAELGLNHSPKNVFENVPGLPLSSLAGDVGVMKDASAGQEGIMTAGLIAGLAPAFGSDVLWLIGARGEKEAEMGLEILLGLRSGLEKATAQLTFSEREGQLVIKRFGLEQ